LASEKKSTDAFEAALKRELQSATHSNAVDCPRSDVLAAYYDRALSRAERAGIDAHLTSCARCQSMMASIARADDSDRTLGGMRGIFWITRLLAPVAVVGVVMAVAIGVSTRRQRTPEVIALASPAGPPRFEAEDRVAPHAEVASQPPAPVAPQTGGLLKFRQPQQLAREEKKTEKPASSSDRNSAALQAETSSAIAPSQNAPAEPARAVGGPAAAVSGATSATRMMAKAPQTNQIASPDGSVAWQFGSGGAISRSGNSRPWLPLHSGVTTDLLAASAPSNDVCWMVGKSGTIVRTLDGGAHWQIIKPPSRDEFAAISATDSNNAIVVAANGQRFVTHDGGVTWSAP
jgi:hypothetical protein